MATVSARKKEVKKIQTGNSDSDSNKRKEGKDGSKITTTAKKTQQQQQQK
jgi:hypothetical protein